MESKSELYLYYYFTVLILKSKFYLVCVTGVISVVYFFHSTYKKLSQLPLFRLRHSSRHMSINLCIQLRWKNIIDYRPIVDGKRVSKLCSSKSNIPIALFWKLEPIHYWSHMTQVTYHHQLRTITNGVIFKYLSSFKRLFLSMNLNFSNNTPIKYIILCLVNLL